MGKTILVIEDDHELCEILETELVSQGYNVKSANNGEDGLKELQNIQPDLIICDRSMPVMSGFELLERMRHAYPQYKNLPFIFLTALSDPRDRHSVTHLNPTAYLEKPVNFDNLAEVVKKALNK